MTECFNCGVPIERARLYDAVSGEGIQKICTKCSIEENIPIIRKPTTFQLKEAEAQKRFHERASEFKKKGFPRKAIDDNEITLREIVDRNYEKNIPRESKPRPELVRNFHWILMRARRMKKLTQEQLAKEIRESETAIKMAEKGILPEDDYRLVNKLESFLRIKIVKKEFEEKVKPNKSYLTFDRQEAKSWTIEDIKEMRRKELELRKQNSLENIGDSEEDFSEDNFEDSPEFEEDSDEISQEDMDRIVFGR